MMNGINYAGRVTDNSTRVEITTSPTSSGSSRTPEMIWICIMIPVVEMLLQEMLEIILTKVYDFPFPCGKTWAAAEKNEIRSTSPDNTRAHEETMEKTETGEANDEAKYIQLEYFILKKEKEDKISYRR